MSTFNNTSLKNNAVDPLTSLGSFNCYLESCQVLCLWALQLLKAGSVNYSGARPGGILRSNHKELPLTPGLR